MLDKICHLARSAGKIIMQFYNSKELINVSYKSDKTPITNVDRKINAVIKKELKIITPDIPIISEEDLYDLSTCRSWNTYWLIDPLDGTKEFLKRNGEFTVNISLIKNGFPVLGVVYAPFFEVLYSSFDKNAWKESKFGLKEKINVSQSKIPLFITSRSHPDKKLNSYLNKIDNYRIKKLGSSLKFCLIAEGIAQCYPRFSNTHIWDTAAGHAIVVAAGGRVQTWKNKDLDYSLYFRSSFINSGFYASA